MSVCVCVCVSVFLCARGTNKEHENITTSVSTIFLLIFSHKDGFLICTNYDVMAVIPVYKCRGDTELLSSVYWHKPREGSTRVDSQPSPGSASVGSIDLLSVG